VHGGYFVPTPEPPTPGPSPTGATKTPTPTGTAPPDGGRLTVVDVSDPDAPRTLGSSAAFYGGPIGIVRSEGPRVWALQVPEVGWRELQVLDVSHPEQPDLADVEFEPPLPWTMHPVDLAIAGDVVYYAAREGVLVLRRMSASWRTATPTTPVTASVTPTITPTKPVTDTATPTPPPTHTPTEPSVWRSTVFLPHVLAEGAVHQP